MTYQEADKIVRCSNYTNRGIAMVKMGLITQLMYEYDYQGTSKALGKIEHNQEQAIKLATLIQEIK